MREAEKERRSGVNAKLMRAIGKRKKWYRTLFRKGTDLRVMLDREQEKERQSVTEEGETGVGFWSSEEQKCTSGPISLRRSGS